MNKENVHYRAIKKYYGDRRSERTRLKYMDHIDEGILVLEGIGASIEAIEAYCLHPIYQLHKNPEELDVYKEFQQELRKESIELAKEYKKYANAYLCKRHYNSKDDIVKVSEDTRVNQMLIADKIQNRKDFEVHYESQENKEVFNRSGDLKQYFKNWLNALEIKEKMYQEYKERLIEFERSN